VSASPHVRLRAGIVVPKYGHTAVERNTVKRRLRELVRTLVLPLGIPVDLVIWAQRAAYGLSFTRLHEDLEQQILPRLRRLDPRGS
jgi:ribonuclease P protein component